ncbi:MAG: YbaB/EbfC family nucleoid-associated protein [Phycisphaerae bacterium]|nr:YbaB/EbfC family nucleoid-associated protein [Gemmatimonadaceae bacterium]
MADFFKLMEQARQLQGGMQKAQEELARKIVFGSAGGGMVSVECDGTGRIKRVKIDPSVVNASDIEMLEDLIAAAAADAQTKAATSAQEEMSKLTGGMDLPFKLPF